MKSDQFKLDYYVMFQGEGENVINKIVQEKDGEDNLLSKLDDLEKTEGIVLVSSKPQPFFKHIIYDLLQENTSNNSEFKINSKIAYVFVDEPQEVEVVCQDAVVYSSACSDEKRTIVPAKYILNYGETGECNYPQCKKEDNHCTTQEKAFVGDIYDCIIKAFATCETGSGVAKVLEIRTRDDKMKWWHRSGIISYFCTVIRTGDSVTFIGEYTLSRYLFGEIGGAVPLPKFPDKLETGGNRIVVGSWVKTNQRDNDDKPEWKLKLSTSAFDNLSNLSRHLQFRDSQITWIMGDPGSGKDLIANALHSGSVKSRLQTFEPRSMAGVSLKELNKRLFLASNENNKNCLIEELEGGGTIFLDEFDKVAEKEEIYGSMLRILEGKEYLKITDEPQFPVSEEIKKYKNINWLFAGAFSQSDPRDSVPSDLWSRLTGFISIKNPLLNDKAYTATLFILFYLVENINLVRPKGEGLKSFVKLIGSPENALKLNERVVRQMCGVEYEGEDSSSVIVPSKILLEIANDFAEHTRYDQTFPSDKIDSSRSIRQAAKVVFFEMLDKCIEEEGDFDFEKRLNDSLRSAHKTTWVARGP